MARITDTAAAHLATGVKPATMRKWLQRGKLTHHGRDYYGRALVDLDEILAFIAPDKPVSPAACRSHTTGVTLGV